MAKSAEAPSPGPLRRKPALGAELDAAGAVIGCVAVLSRP